MPASHARGLPAPLGTCARGLATACLQRAEATVGPQRVCKEQRPQHVCKEQRPQSGCKEQRPQSGHSMSAKSRGHSMSAKSRGHSLAAKSRGHSLATACLQRAEALLDLAFLTLGQCRIVPARRVHSASSASLTLPLAACSGGDTDTEELRGHLRSPLAARHRRTIPSRSLHAQWHSFFSTILKRVRPDVPIFAGSVSPRKDLPP